MTNWTTIEELRDIFIRKFIEHDELAKDLEKACNEEYELKRDYNGRQILELLQNVDDACCQSDGGKSSEATVKIVFKDNVLEVGNTGTVFSNETIERLCLGRVSEKSAENIGNKGTGFRSLLNDAEWIEVHSGGFSVKFSECYAQEQFKAYIDENSEKCNETVCKQYKRWKKDYPLCFPILYCPQQIEKVESEFDTLIRVKIKEENNKKEAGIANQLKQPFYKSLLFLPNITKIEIITDESRSSFEKILVDNSVLLEENGGTLGEYYVKEKKINITDDKTANLIIAVPSDKNYDFTNEKLYCYFPIRNFSAPVHALIHAPFMTNNSRDDVPNDNEQINKKLFQESLKFLKEVVEDMCQDGFGDVVLPIKTATPTNNFKGKVWSADVFNLQPFYYDLLKNAKILPTVNGEFIAVNDKPKCFKHEFPTQFKGEPFKELLILLPPDVYEFVKILSFHPIYDIISYANETLADKINQITGGLSVAEQASIFLWWNEHYRKATVVPDLLKDTTGKWIKVKEVYLPTDNKSVSLLPATLSWVNLCVLDQVYVDELIKQLNECHKDLWDAARTKLTAENISNKRILDKVSDLYFSISFKEQSNADMIIGEIVNQVDTCDKAVAFIRWFYENYKEKIQENQTGYNANYKLPDRDNNLKPTGDLYFGREYGNELAEKLFSKSKRTAVADLKTLFGDKENERDEILHFLKRCKISYYPEMAFYKKDYFDGGTTSDDAQFKAYIQKKHNVAHNINYIAATYIKDFEDILKSLTTKEITQWITEDRDLCNLILSYEQTGYAAQKSNSIGTPIEKNEYIKYVLNKTKWIEINEKKYSPHDIVKNAKLRDKIDGIYGISESELIALLGRRVVTEMRLEFVESLASFPDKTIKEILFKLPEVDKGEISRALYEDIIKLKRDKQPGYSTEGIRVLATDGKYYDNKEVRYANKRLPRSENISAHLIHIPIKRSTETIQRWLGVEQYKMNLELNDYKSATHAQIFDSEFVDIKIAVLSMLDETDNYIMRTRNLKVIPCEDIKVTDIENNNAEFYLEDEYNYIKKEGKYYIKVPADFGAGKIENPPDFVTAITEIFEDAVSPQIDVNLLAYLIKANTSEKKKIIGERYNIDKWDHVYELLFQKKRVNELAVEFFAKNGLDEKMLEALKEIDFSNDLTNEEYLCLKNSLKAISKDLDDLSKHIVYRIDLREQIKNEVLSYRDNYSEKYKISLYRRALVERKAQTTFWTNVNKFKCFVPDIEDIRNTIYQDPEEILKKRFAEFVPSVEDLNLSIDGVYNQNYNIVLLASGVSRGNLDAYLDTHQEKKSQLYFVVPENLTEELKILSAEEEEKVKLTEAERETEVGYNEDETSITETTLVPVHDTKEPTTRVMGEKSQKQYDREAANKERAGKKAEQIAYAELKKHYPNLIWHSKNSDIPADKNNGPVNIVCDMWVTDEKTNKKTYFEVKAATTEFEMSINEYNSMEAAPQDYVVVLVNIETRKISTHSRDELIGLRQVSKYKFCFIQIQKN